MTATNMSHTIELNDVPRQTCGLETNSLVVQSAGENIFKSYLKQQKFFKYVLLIDAWYTFCGKIETRRSIFVLCSLYVCIFSFFNANIKTAKNFRKVIVWKNFVNVFIPVRAFLF